MSQFPGDRYDESVRQQMLLIVADDEPYWSDLGWWRVYDEAKRHMS